jgi:uncharacterized protein (TIGR03083 family)
VTAAAVVAAVATRTGELRDRLEALDDPALLGPSHLPGWDRLTIVCHLRYGAEALLRMTDDGLAGRPTSFYPGGRDRQRPGTLRPRAGERPADVVEAFADTGTALAARWASLDEADWETVVSEPDGPPDLGALPLSRLPLLRLTEVEVHGTDLDIGADEWSDVFVATALPMRVQWLNQRRTNHRSIDPTVQGSWLLAATDGPAYLVATTPDGGATAAVAEPGAPADAVIEASGRDLLALLLGRPQIGTMTLGGDTALAARFSAAFPGP